MPSAPFAGAPASRPTWAVLPSYPMAVSCSPFSATASSSKTPMNWPFMTPTSVASRRARRTCAVPSKPVPRSLITTRASRAGVPREGVGELDGVVRAVGGDVRGVDGDTEPPHAVTKIKLTPAQVSPALISHAPTQRALTRLRTAPRVDVIVDPRCALTAPYASAGPNAQSRVPHMRPPEHRSGGRCRRLLTKTPERKSRSGHTPSIPRRRNPRQGRCPTPK